MKVIKEASTWNNIFLGITVPKKSRNGLEKQVSAIHSERSKRRIQINKGKQISKLEEEKAFFNFKTTDDILDRYDLQGYNKQI